MAREPASIRYKNPGAMWGNNAIARRWGATKTVGLNDGKGQGNNIAVFPTFVKGICAQLDLWRSSKNYRNKRFQDAIAIWSGHNEVESYIAFVLKRVPGMTRNTVMDDAFWRSARGVAFLKAQAWHEAGKKYPAPDADWLEAQRIVMGDEAPGAAPEKTPPPIGELVPTAPAKPAAPVIIDETTVQGDPEVWHVQRRLKAMKYNPGGVDGKWGGMTGGAITAFINDRQVAITAPTSEEMFQDILPVLRDEIAKAETESFTRPIAKERAEATSTEVAKKIETVEASKSSKFWSFILGIPAMVVAFIKGVVDNFESALTSPLLNGVKEFFADNVLYVALGVVGIAGWIWFQSRRAEKGTVRAFREGRLT